MSNALRIGGYAVSARLGRRSVLSFSRSGIVITLLAASLLALFLWTPAEPQTPADGVVLTGRASVIDGDTLAVGDQRIRLWGIDAPESDQPCRKASLSWRCGRDSAEALDAFLSGRTVTCVKQDMDRYGRIVAVCRADGLSAGAWMVGQGWALDYGSFSGGVYAAEEERARKAARGLWQGSFERPWVWRERKRAQATGKGLSWQRL